MSILDDYEEIDFSEESTKHSQTPHRVQNNQTPEKLLAFRLSKLKSNPDTYDYESILNQVKRPTKFSSKSPPVVDRMLFNHQLSQNRKRFLIQQKEYEDLKLCTFSPKITNSKSSRSFKDFYNQQTQFLKKKAEKIDSLKYTKIIEKQADEKNNLKTFEISRGSKLILERNEKTNKRVIKESKSGSELLQKTVSLGQGVFKSMAKPPLPKPKF